MTLDSGLLHHMRVRRTTIEPSLASGDEAAGGLRGDSHSLAGWQGPAGKLAGTDTTILCRSPIPAGPSDGPWSDSDVAEGSAAAKPLPLQSASDPPATPTSGPPRRGPGPAPWPRARARRVGGGQAHWQLSPVIRVSRAPTPLAFEPTHRYPPPLLLMPPPQQPESPQQVRNRSSSPKEWENERFSESGAEDRLRLRLVRPVGKGGRATRKHILLRANYISRSVASEWRLKYIYKNGFDHYKWALPVANAGRTSTTHRVMFRPYREPDNAYAYIIFNSFHGQHNFH